MKTETILKKISVIVFALGVCLSSCKKDPPVVTPHQAGIASTSIWGFRASYIVEASEGPLYEYSSVEITRRTRNEEPEFSERVDAYVRWLLDSVSVFIDGTWAKTAYIVEENKITVSPDPYFKKSGELTLTVYTKKLYSPTPGEIPANEGGWLLLELNSEEIKYQVLTDLTLTEDDFAVTYPMNRQLNFLRKEYDKGYFILNGGYGQMKMFDRRIYVMIKDVLEEDFTGQEEIVYNPKLNVLEYWMPTNMLLPRRVYNVEIRDMATDQTLYEYFFATSKFDNFTEKWETLKDGFGSRFRRWINWHDYAHRHNMHYSEEVLDLYETEYNAIIYESVNNRPETMPLIQFETHVPESWKNTADWLIYEQPSLTFRRSSSWEKKYGFPPVRAIGFSATPVFLTDEQCTTGNINISSNSFGFFWIVQGMTRWDASSASVNARITPEAQRTEWQNIAANNYPDLPRLDLDFVVVINNKRPDDYPPMDVFYVLPGINIETTIIRNFQLP